MNFRNVILFKVKVLLIIYCLLLFNQPIFSLGEVRVTMWGGYSTVSMDDLNKQLESKADYMFKNSDGYQPSVRRFSDSIIFGFDVLYKLSHDIYVGPRIAFLSSSGEVLGRTTVLGYTQINPPYDPIYDAKISLNTFLIPIMFGGVYSKEILKKMFFSGKIFIGFANAYFTSRFEWYKEYGYTESTYVEYFAEGNGVVSDLSTAIEYRISKNLSTELSIGYKIARITNMHQTKEYKTLYIGKTKEIVVQVEDEKGNKIPFDFSGMDFTFGLKYRF
jgi:hypothetical protein